MSALRKIADIIIYSHEHFHSAMPSAVTLPNGEVLVAFRRAPDRRLLGIDKVTHVDPNAQLVLVRSNDNGNTWSQEPELICAHPLAGCQDPCLTLLQDGSLLCTSYGWTPADTEYAKSEPLKIRAGSYLMIGGFFTRSKDGGRTWSTPETAPRLEGNATCDPFNDTLPCFNRGATVTETDGRLLWSVTRQPDSHRTHGAIELLASKNNGKSWEQISTIAEHPECSLNESSLYVTPNGDIVCFIRSFGMQDHTVVARSSDHGKSFEWFDAGWQGHPHHALGLPDGRVLLVYGYRHDPIGIRARLLDPECNNAADAKEIVLRNDGGSWDIGYPWSTLLPNGDVLVVYYFNIKDGTRFIAGSVLEID